MKQVFYIAALALLLSNCSQPVDMNNGIMAPNKQLPRVLYITTGISNENAQLAQGVVVAIQALNKRGAIVRLEPRDILFDISELMKYNIIILSTFPGYHDADRQYSLSYMLDEELHNLSQFVRQGGVIISGDNVGRNSADGTDRILEHQQLNPENWELSPCFGLSLSEKNMTSYQNEGEIGNYSKWQINAGSVLEEDAELWTLVPDSVFSKKIKILGSWKNGKDSIPSFIQNRFEKGTAYLMSSSSFLQPVNDGGYWSLQQIEDFYNYVIDEYNQSNGLHLSLNPWPNAYEYAFCVTLNSAGTVEQYDRVFQLLEAEDIQPTLFVNGLLNDTVSSFLKSSHFDLESSGYAYKNFKYLKYPQAIEDILRNENKWDIDFHGFRFPYTQPGYWGLLVLDKLNYTFESSIGVNNIDFIHGSAFPYNIVISNDGFYKSTDIMEVAPIYHDDYYFLKIIGEEKELNHALLKKDVMIYSKYLETFWDKAIKPYKGLMVYLGHPQYVGYNDTTLTSLKTLIDKVKQDNTWVTTINDVANFRKNLSQLQFYIEANKGKLSIEIIAPETVKLENVCLNFTGKVKNAISKAGDIKILKNSEGYQLIFTAFNGQTITVEYE